MKINSYELDVNNLMNRKNIRIADFSDGPFQTIEGFPHPSQRSIMPVVAVKGDEIRPVGTCFAISNHGLVLTARHVIDDALRLGVRENPTPDGWWLGALYIAEPESGDPATADLNGGILPVNTVHFIPSLDIPSLDIPSLDIPSLDIPSLDIAAMHLKLPINTITNESLHIPSLRLSPGIPAIDLPCVAIGYHSMNWTRQVEGIATHQILQSYSASRGLIKTIHFPRRDTRSHTFPCFETSARFDGGMSGAPVIIENGGVVGVVCSSFRVPYGHGDISYASLVGTSLFLQIPGQNADGSTETKFLYDFVVGGSVAMDNTASTLTIERRPDVLTINFGQGPAISNRILHDDTF